MTLPNPPTLPPPTPVPLAQIFCKIPMPDATRAEDPIFALVFKQGTNRRFFWLQTPTAEESAPCTTAQRNIAIAAKIDALINGRSVSAAVEATAAGTAAPVAEVAAAAAPIDATAGDLGDFSNLLGAIAESSDAAGGASAGRGLSMEDMLAVQQAMAAAGEEGVESEEGAETQTQGKEGEDDDDDAMYDD